ncbi:MAG: ATP-binding cassette domain-containing protein [Bryobacteraceae bacterium]|nr:ATP-binding cassette domain-containing protein [Bryobacteraceae bacterium]
MPGDEQSILRFENVTVTLDEITVLDGITFEMRKSDTCVILGAAGSGKTVLLKTAIGLIKPSTGKVFLFDTDITELDEQELFDLRAKTGVLFQEGALFDSLTIEENVAYPLVNQRAAKRRKREIRELVEESLRFVELAHTLDKFPSELSGGMRRRVGIARAIVTEPPLVLYDSPTAGLDPITANTIVTLIIKERDVKKTTTVVVTHRYQDGHLLANFRYNPGNGQVEPVTGNGHTDTLKTRFLVLRQGRLTFVGDQQQLEASADPYVSKFVKREI